MTVEPLQLLAALLNNAVYVTSINMLVKSFVTPQHLNRRWPAKSIQGHAAAEPLRRGIRLSWCKTQLHQPRSSDCDKTVVQE